jgi:hypothetical protein
MDDSCVVFARVFHAAARMVQASGVDLSGHVRQSLYGLNSPMALPN